MMFVLAILFMIVGIMVYAGKTELIHEYNRKNVEDEIGYAKAMGKALLGIAFFISCQQNHFTDREINCFFLSFRCDTGIWTARFLRFYFQNPEKI